MIGILAFSLRSSPRWNNLQYWKLPLGIHIGRTGGVPACKMVNIQSNLGISGCNCGLFLRGTIDLLPPVLFQSGCGRTFGRLRYLLSCVTSYGIMCIIPFLLWLRYLEDARPLPLYARSVTVKRKQLSTYFFSAHGLNPFRLLGR